ncbi:sensor histidine kinase [Pseudohalocynthiibacter aestuariivivens]|jgi:signal transduction histidine kinase|uniref:histidine kinase n=1 Tax=Pseudohalocynthiibacter aestuariivivens TaxID=1591409 RepID=A0ABV5JN01_9RHOB|nr:MULTISPECIES: HAMP domain-containing sensor histidine kinase [Pseudohalocynthiibacter]MBS9715568.1 HAMP domain-containing histidine kinase [Pseudohalocynthiibacter aestuariivivens]MCK0101167.1 HAMP domain-containing histidine kinase [Pseudohalocynthiibacter sp. F2068]
MVLNSLSGRFLLLTILFVMLAEVLIFVPSVARFREDYLLLRLERAQIASLAVLADDMIDQALEAELLENAGVFNVVLRRDDTRQLMLSSPVPGPVFQTFDLRDAGAYELIRDALMRILDRQDRVIRVLGEPVRQGGLLIEITMASGPLRSAMLDYGINILLLSAVISAITASLLFMAVRGTLVLPIRRVVTAMQSYAASPEDARTIINPSANIIELREAENALQSMQTELTQSLKQKDRLAQLGGAVAKVSHDLRNILTVAQLMVDRLESSDDPTVKRSAPKLVNSISRAVHLCESTLTFGKAEEPAPVLSRIDVAQIVRDVIEGERLAVGECGIRFSQDVPEGMELRADSDQLHRVLSNLIRNARQAIVATGKDGEISVQADEDDGEWFITVSDTGPGLPPKAREHLFTPFQGGIRKGGTGLGLAIAAELARGHGGRLDLLASDHTGTKFAIRIPKGDSALDAVSS